jgi:hypothetical protein
VTLDHYRTSTTSRPTKPKPFEISSSSIREFSFTSTFGAHAWNIRVWPKAETVVQEQSPLPTVSLIRGKCKAANTLAMHDLADANGKLDNKESFLTCGTTNDSPRSLFAKVFRYLKT